MNPRILLILTISCICIPAAAQVTVSVANESPATKEQIQKLFDVMQIRQQSHLMMDSMQKQMQAMSTQTIKARYPQITAAELARANKISEDMFKDLPLDAMLDDMVPVYQRHLSQSDVDAMIVFYSSPAGKKLMHEMPEITQEAMQVSYKRMQKQIDAVMKQVDDMEKEEKQPQGQPKSNAPQSPPAKPN